MVDTDGRGLILEPQPADVQDRDGAVAVLRLSRRAFPFVAKAFADAGYAGDKPATATIITVEIVRKPPDQIGFAVHPRRWVVERFFSWISVIQARRRGPACVRRPWMGPSPQRAARSRGTDAGGLRHHVVERDPAQTGFVVLAGRWVVEHSFVWLVHWGGLLRDRAGRLDVSAARIAFAASLSGVEALLNPMPVQDAAR